MKSKKHPSGARYDCYRHWECLLCGSYPIMIKTPLHKDLFSDLPVIMVDSWDQVSPRFLKEVYQKWQGVSWKTEKLYADYWIQPILDQQKNLRQSHRF